MVFAEADEVDPDLVGQRSLRHDFAQHLRVRQRPTVAVNRDISERIQTQFDRVWHVAPFDSAHRAHAHDVFPWVAIGSL